jgi:hypothetical protein
MSYPSFEHGERTITSNISTEKKNNRQQKPLHYGEASFFKEFHMSLMLEATICQISNSCQKDPILSRRFDAIRTMASGLRTSHMNKELWLLLNLFGEWVPGILLLLQQMHNSPSRQEMNLQDVLQALSSEEIEKLHHVIQILGPQGYLLLIDTLMQWLQSTLPTRRRKNTQTNWTGNGLVMLVQDLDGTRVLPPALQIWAKVDLLRELNYFKALLNTEVANK